MFLWGIIQKNFVIKHIYRYTMMHLLDWFPRLPSYQAFNRRLNELAPAFQELSAILLESPTLEMHHSAIGLIDSFPIILAKNYRSSQAKIARELCSKTYSASKGLWYYGMKLNVLGCAQFNHIPIPVIFLASTASAHDLTIAKEIFATSSHSLQKLYADKAYCDTDWKESLAQAGVQLHTPRKKPLGFDDVLYPKDFLSVLTCQIRQPIESFFNWLDEKTNIQHASKVRSTKGLLSHIFGRIAAALCIMALNFNT